MGIARFENVEINTVTNGVDTVGQYTTTITPWFATRARVSDVANSLRIAEKYRAYQELVNLTFNYTPNMKTVANNQHLHSVTYRDLEWRITDVRESNDRMSITFLCFYNDPNTPV